MTFTRVPDPNLDPDKPVRSADLKQIRDNQDDHESRLVSVEDASIRVFSHFVSFRGVETGGGGYSSSIITTNNDVVNFEGGKFYLASTAALVQQIIVSTTADDHYLRWTPGAAGVGQCIANLSFNFASRTKPITFNWRFRTSDNTNAFFLGLTNLPASKANTTPTDGIYLLLGGAGSTFRFRSTSSVSGLSTTGSDIAFANNTWYEVKILFEDTPGNQARCYVDGLLKETFTTNLPTTINMFGRYTFASGAGDTFDLDRALVSAAGTLSDVP